MRFSVGDGIGVVSAALVLFGGLLPWASVTVPPQIEGFTPHTAIWWGYNQEGGVIMMILSLISLAVIAITKRPVRKRVVIASIGVVIFSVALFYCLTGPSMCIEGIPVKQREGLPISLIGGLGLVASIALMRAHKEKPSPTQNLASKSPI